MKGMRDMYVRPPSSRHHGVRLPENYSGSAFSHQSPYSEMPPPTRMQGQIKEAPTAKIAPQMDLPLEETEPKFVSPQYYEEKEENIEMHEERQQESNAPASIFSSLLPKADLSSHFPFGHGIGSEELLILAVMLMVFLSGNETGEVDSEFILLLGLLLFAG